MKIRIKRFDKDLPLPVCDDRAAGLDLYCRETVIVPARQIALVPVNNAVEVPDGYFLLLVARSSTPLRRGLMLANGIGVVDPFFCGDKDEIKIQLLNITDQPVEVKKGDLLTQAILMKHEPMQLEEVETFGHGGHGGYWK